MASTCALNQEGRDSSPEAQEAFIQFIDIDYVALDLVLDQAIKRNAKSTSCRRCKDWESKCNS
mgnify:CR=1 FL=1